MNQAITHEMISGFSAYLAENEKSLMTIEKYVRDVKMFRAWLGGEALGKNAVVAYKQYLVSNHALSSVNSMLASLNSFLGYIGMSGFRVKTLRVQKQIFASDDRQLTKDEYKRLLKAAEHTRNKRLNLIMQTICSTGIRVSELKYVTVEAVREGKAEVNLKGKVRVILLNKNLRRLLASYTKTNNIASGAVFITRSGKSVNRSNIWAEMKNLCSCAHIDPKKVFPHNLRHLFARTFYGIDKDIVKLANLLGHSSIETTRIYTKGSMQECVRIINNLGLVI